MEVCCGWIIIQTSCKGVGKLSRWAHFSHKDVRHRKAAFHAALPCHEHSRKLLIIDEPGSIDHTAHIQNHNDAVKFLFHLGHKGGFLVRQAEIAVLENLLTEFGLMPLIRNLPLIADALPVPALAGETADDNQGRVRKLCRPGKKLCRNLRLHSHARNRTACVLLFHVLPVEICQRLIDLGQAFFFLEAVVEISHMGNGHVAASAAAFHIVKNAFAEKGQPGALCQRKDFSGILKKHHTFRTGLSGQSQMLRAGCYLSAVLA